MNEARSLQEVAGVSLNSSNLEWDIYEKAIDRVAAIGKGHKLGRLLWHWKYAGQDVWLKEAWRLLIRIAAKRYKIRTKAEYAILERACCQALREWYFPLCRKCGGKGEIEAGELKIICVICEGSARHRYSDWERAEAMKTDDIMWQRRIAEIVMMVYSRDAMMSRLVSQQLERGRFRLVKDLTA